MTTNNPQIAATILAQLGGSRRLGVMTGAHNFIDHGNGLSFRVRGNRSPRPNYVEVKLNGADLYDVRFCRIHGLNIRGDDTIENVHVESLIELIEPRTGLYLSL